MADEKNWATPDSNRNCDEHLSTPSIDEAIMKLARDRGIYLKLLLCLVGATLLYVIFESLSHSTKVETAMTEENIISEAREVRKTIRGETVDISEIVKKYIKLGSSREAVRVYLLNLGFSLSFQPIKESGKEVLIAVEAPLNKTFFGFLGFEDEVKLVIDFNQGNVETLSGQIIFDAL